MRFPQLQQIRLPIARAEDYQVVLNWWLTDCRKAIIVPDDVETELVETLKRVGFLSAERRSRLVARFKSELLPACGLAYLAEAIRNSIEQSAHLSDERRLRLLKQLDHDVSRAHRSLKTDSSVSSNFSSTLLQVVELLFSQRTISLIFDPILADANAEAAEAFATGRKWKARAIYVRGCYELAKAFGVVFVLELGSFVRRVLRG